MTDIILNLRARIAQEYTWSMLGNGLAYSVSVAPDRTNCQVSRLNAAIQRVVKQVQLGISTRMAEPLVDIWLRGGQRRICVPHLPAAVDIPPKEGIGQLRFRSKLPATTKAQLSLSELLAYAIDRCTGKWRGALIPYRMSMQSEQDHMGMIYIDMRKGQGSYRCYLFDPNGVSYVREHPQPAQFLQSAWSELKRRRSDLMLAPRVLVTGGSGIQTQLGLLYDQTREGLGVCGAVTYWVFRKWIRSSEPSFVRYHNQLQARIIASPRSRRKYRRLLFDFIVSTRKRMEREYSNRLRVSLEPTILEARQTVQRATRNCQARIRLRINLTTSNPRIRPSFRYTL